MRVCICPLNEKAPPKKIYRGANEMLFIEETKSLGQMKQSFFGIIFSSPDMRMTKVLTETNLIIKNSLKKYIKHIKKNLERQCITDNKQFGGQPKFSFQINSNL